MAHVINIATISDGSWWVSSVTGEHVRVRRRQANVALASLRLEGLSEDEARRLLDLTDRLATPLAVAVGLIRAWVREGTQVSVAVGWFVELLAAGGAAMTTAQIALADAGSWVEVEDVEEDSPAGRLVKICVDAALARLGTAERERVLDVVAFPAEAPFPAETLLMLWERELRRDGSDALLGRLLALGLVRKVDRSRVMLLDGVRTRLRGEVGPERERLTHTRVVDVAYRLLGHAGPSPVGAGSMGPAAGAEWWSLLERKRDGADEISDGLASYWATYLIMHLVMAGRGEQAAALVSDLRWIRGSILRTGSVEAVEADLGLAGVDTASRLRVRLYRDAHLLVGRRNPATLGPMLAARLGDVPELRASADVLRESAGWPRLTPVWPLPDQPHPALVRHLDGHTGEVVHGVAFSPAGGWLASFDMDGVVRLWNASDGRPGQTLTGHTGDVNIVAFSPDGRVVASGSDDGTVRLWDVATGALVRALQHQGDVSALAFTPDGRTLASGSGDGRTRLWGVSDGALAGVIKHDATVGQVAFSPDGRLLAAADEGGHVVLWDRAAAGGHLLPGHLEGELTVAFSPNGRYLASAGADDTVLLWDVVDGSLRRAFDGHTDWICRVAFSPNGRHLASCSADQTIRVWTDVDGPARHVLTGHTGGVNRVAFSPDSTLLASASDDRTARLWRLDSGTARAVLHGHHSFVTHAEFSPDGARLATAAHVDTTIRLWNPHETAEPVAHHARSDHLNTVAFSPDGTVLAAGGGNGGDATLWTVADGTLHQSLQGRDWSLFEATFEALNPYYVRCVAFSPDGRTLATVVGDQSVRLWNPTDGTLQTELPTDNEEKYLAKVAFSRDGRHLAAAGYLSFIDPTVWTTDDQDSWTAGGEYQPEDYPYSVTDFDGTVVYAPDGRKMMRDDDDGRVRLVSTATYHAYRVLRPPADHRLHGLAFSPDSRLALTWCDTGTLQIWDLRTSQPIAAFETEYSIQDAAWHTELIAAVGTSGIFLFRYQPNSA